MCLEYAYFSTWDKGRQWDGKFLTYRKRRQKRRTMERVYGIRKNVIEQIKELASRYQLERVILFGSRARGDYHKTSDIDLAASGGNVTEFALDVDEDTDTLLQFDVVNLDKPVQEELLQSIQREGIILYEKV